MQRLLGPSEHLLWHLARARPVNAVLCARLSGPLTIPRLREALDFAQRRHALLGVRIRTDDAGRPHFVSEGVPPIPLRCLPRRDEQHWVQEVEDELTRPFALEEGPLLRATLLQGAEDCELVLSFDHSIGDGMSGALLVRDLLRELSQPGRGECLPEPAACEDLLPEGVSLPEEPPRASPHPRVLAESRLPLTGEATRRVRLLTWELTEEETARLVTASRREGTTVHGALCAAFLRAMATEPEARGEAILKVMSPVNLRDHLVPPGTEAFAACFTRQLTRHLLQPTSRFWEVARDVKHQLQRDTKGPGKFLNLLKVRDFLATSPDGPSLQAFVRDLMGSELTVTNLGRWGHEQQYGPFRLERLYVTVSGLAPLIVSVTTLGGRLSLCSRFLEAVIPEARAQRLQQGAREQLRAALAAHSGA